MNLDELITLFDTNYQEAEQWVKDNSAEAAAWDVSRSQLEQLAVSYYQKFQALKLTEAGAVELLSSQAQAARTILNNLNLKSITYSSFDDFFTLAEKGSLCANALYKANPEPINDLIISQEQYLALAKKTYTLAEEIQKNQPEKIAGFLNEWNFFKSLLEAWRPLAEAVFAQSPAKVVDLLPSWSEFMNLQKAWGPLAKKVFEQNPKKISELCIFAANFNELVDRSTNLARSLFEVDKLKIALLFNEATELRKLQHADSNLAQEIIQIRRQNSLEVPDLSSPKEPMRSESSSYSADFDPFEQKRSQPAYFRLEYVPSHSYSRRNYSFVLAALSSIALLGGVAMFVAGIVLAQPELVAGGVLVGLLGAAGLGFFNAQSRRSENLYSEDYRFGY